MLTLRRLTTLVFPDGMQFVRSVRTSAGKARAPKTDAAAQVDASTVPPQSNPASESKPRQTRSKRTPKETVKEPAQESKENSSEISNLIYDYSELDGSGLRPVRLDLYGKYPLMQQ